ncbi:flavodoxin family protein [Rhodococcus zopfii]|uniref:Flavodoxin family protein n=1 Tax=Rhodococcus zopfii TaxID=43772 RepID=A0ABU3WMS1_9NOCA|nr:flavodoxin family protein [Rhodococcus zopfii]
MPEVTVAVADRSGHGHTEQQAKSVVWGAESVDGVDALLVDVEKLGENLRTTLAGADAIVSGTPTSMAGHSAVFQSFAEASSVVWAEQGWKDQVAAGFTNSAGVNGDKLNTLVGLSLFAAQHEMTWVGLDLPPGWAYTSAGRRDSLNALGSFLGAMAQSPSVLAPAKAPVQADLDTAAHLGRRVAEHTPALSRRRQVVAQ